jgi:hypothetical protein
MDVTSPAAPPVGTPRSDPLARLQASLGPETPLAGIPDGVVARSVQRIRADENGWRQVRDRRRRQRLTEVMLTAAQAQPHDIARHLTIVLGLSPGNCNFILDAQRRSWPAIQQKLGEHARSIAFDLVRCGAIYLKCAVTEDLSLGPPTSWYLTEAGTASAAQRSAAADSARADLDLRRHSVLTRLMILLDRTVDPPQVQGTNPAGVSRDAVEALAAALEGANGPARLPVLIAAAEDLLDGITHGSPRDFSLAHFTHSKERDDVAYLLADAGVPDEIAATLGIRRSPRLGVAGAIDAIVAGQNVPLSLLDGPVLLRADQPGLTLATTARSLVIVENLQAAESLAAQSQTTTSPQPLAIIYSAGQPSPPARRLIASLCSQVEATLLCPDADLGGVRIARAILDELSPAVTRTVEISDPGEWPHRPQPFWPADGATVTGLTRALDGPVGTLARACLTRGYRVEQETSIRLAVSHWLASRRTV